jgi:hypothetical protein
VISYKLVHQSKSVKMVESKKLEPKYLELEGDIHSVTDESNGNCVVGNVELVARSLFFDSIPKRKCKRKRMRRDLLRTAASACLIPTEEVDVRDSSTISINAIHLNSNESSISSTFTSEESFKQAKKVKFDDKSRLKEYENIITVAHPFYNSTKMQTVLSKCVADNTQNTNLAQISDKDAQNTEEYLNQCARNFSFKAHEAPGLSNSQMNLIREKFIASLPSKLLPSVGENPLLFAGLPITLGKAVKLSPHARFITQAQAPFRIIYANAAFGKLFEHANVSVVGKPLATLKENVFNKIFLSLQSNNPLGIKLELVGKSSSSSKEKTSSPNVTHFLIEIEIDSLAESMSTAYSSEMTYASSRPVQIVG